MFIRPEQFAHLSNFCFRRVLFSQPPIPWIEFTSFNLNVFSTGTHLPPIFTTGKLIKENGRVKLPFCLQVHHSICDGYHAGKLFDYLQNLADKADSWLESSNSNLTSWQIAPLPHLVKAQLLASFRCIAFPRFAHRTDKHADP